MDKSHSSAVYVPYINRQSKSVIWSCSDRWLRPYLFKSKTVFDLTFCSQMQHIYCLHTCLCKCWPFQTEQKEINSTLHISYSLIHHTERLDSPTESVQVPGSLFVCTRSLPCMIGCLLLRWKLTLVVGFWQKKKKEVMNDWEYIHILWR